MNFRLALRSALIFCVALGVGRLLLPGAPQRVTKQAPAITGAVPLVAVAAPAHLPQPVTDRTPKEPPVRPVVREFRAVDGGVLNENVRLSHFISSQYTEGSFHRAPQQFGAFVRWAPRTQELRRAGQAVAVVEAAPVRASLEKAAGHNRVFFPATYPDTDERMFVRRDGGLEHDIVLRQPPQGLDDSYALAYTGILQLSPGLTLWDGKQQITAARTTSNAVQIKNQFGNTVFCLRRPVAWDATVTASDGGLDKEKQAVNPQAAAACEYRIDFDDAGVSLAVLTPGRWLTDPLRAYPVVIDPNLGPYGLADGDPPIYVGTVGSDTLIPANAGGQPVAITDTCPGKTDNGAGQIPMPFAFEYYGVVHAINDPLYVHIDGFASWELPDPCADTDNQPIPTPGYPDDAFFAYWDDLRFSTQQGCGIYWFVDGVAPSRRLVIEWYKMAFSSGVANEYISFNLVLYECDNKIQIIIGQADEKDRGFCSVGIEDPTGLTGIQYDFNSALSGAWAGNQQTYNPYYYNPDPTSAWGGGGWGGGGVVGGYGGYGGYGGTTGGTTGGTAGTGNQMGPISPGTSISCQRSAMGFLTVGFSPLTGCIPHTVCFRSEITTPASTCATGQTIPTSFGYHWDFKDNSQGFTSSLCHTWVTPGIYPVTLDIVDEFGTTSHLDFTVKVCDIPDVVIEADPQGGTVPVNVSLAARANSPTVRITSAPLWVIDRLGTNNEPGQFLTIGALSGSPVSVRFDSPGIYRVTVNFSGLDTASGLPTTGAGVVFIFAAVSNDVIDDSFLITESRFQIDWVGKRDGPDPDGLPPNPGSATPGLGMPDNPENDTLMLRGYLSLPGVQPSQLLGRRARLVLNGVDTVLDAVFDADGKAVQPAQENGRAGALQLKLPSGAFWCTVKRSLYVQLGVCDGTMHRMIPAHFRLEIEGFFPPPGSPGAMITYDYSAVGYNPGPPASGTGTGVYRFGAFTREGSVGGSSVPADFGKPGGQELLLTGAFMVINAKVKLEGNSVYADLKGKLARYGGDDLRPRDNSDVVVSLGNWSEALNFSATAGFKAGGKPPLQRFSFKRAKAMGKTGIAALQWVNGAGDFRIKTNALPNELVGLNPALGLQTMILGLTITPDGAQVFQGKCKFDVTKKKTTEFVRKGK